MKIFSIILMMFGYAAIVIQLYWAFILGWQMAAHVGEAIVYAIVFLLPGIILYRKSSKKTTDSKGGQYKGDVDATKESEAIKEKTSKTRDKKEDRKA